jgi:hypothetical protein
MKFAELGPKNPAYLAYSQREAAARGVETPRFARRDAVILFTDFVGSIGAFPRGDKPRSSSNPVPRSRRMPSCADHVALGRAMGETVRRSRPFTRLAARQIVLNPASAVVGRPLHSQRALSDAQNACEGFLHQIATRDMSTERP